jgi:DHA1 family multidrug resistance protein-like MFS transporter
VVSQEKSVKDRAFWIFCVIGLFAILSSTMSKSPVLKPFSLSLGTPTDWSGFVAAASTIPGILVSLPAASLSDIYGRKKFLLMAGFVFASAPFLYLFITVWWQLILVRFYHGFATAIFVPVVEASIAELFPTKRGERISLFSSATYVGRFVAPTLGGYILFVTANDFHVLYLSVAVAGVTALIIALPLSAGRKQSPIASHGSAMRIVGRLFRGWRIVAGGRGVLAVSFVQACQYYAFAAVEFFLAGYLPEIVHLNEFLTGIIITSIIGVAIFARPYMGRVSDKMGRRIPIAVGCVVSGLPLLAFSFVTDFWLLLLLALVYGLGFAAVTASTSALISELVPRELVGTSMGFLDTIMDVGQTFGPIISGLVLATRLQYRGVFPSLALVVLFSCVTFVLSIQNRKLASA